MRLVKIGSLAAEIEKREKNERYLSDYQIGINDGLRTAEMVVEDAPTIEAIPITFIWDFMDKIEEEIAQTDDSDPRMPGLCARHNALRALLQAWEEEEKKND